MSEKISTIGDLIQDRTNPRKHNPRNLKTIVDSLHDVGFARSIVIDEDNNILAGNGVTEAAAIAGIEKVIEIEADGNTIIAVRRRGLTDGQKQRLKYFDNRSGELAEWNVEQLFADMGAGLDLSGMFREDELDALLAGMQPLDDPNAHWQGMPEFEQDDLTSFRSVHVHFKTQADVDAFAQLIGQELGNKARSVWYPEAEKIDMYSELYVDES